MAEPPSHRLGVGPVDHPVLGEARRHRDVEEAALAAGEDLGQAGHRLGELPVGGDDAEPAGPLGDQVAAVRQEREAPGMLEARARSVSTASATPEDVAGARVCSGKAGWKAGTLGGPCSTGEADCAQAAVPPSNAAKARLAVVTGVMTGILLRQCVSRGKPLARCDVPSQRREGTRSLPAGGAARFCH